VAESAPRLIAIFLALVVLRGRVESNDAFSRFWDQAMAGRTSIAVVVDCGSGSTISPAMADAAMPVERLADMLHVPVHIVAANGMQSRGTCVVRLSLTEKPLGHQWFRLGGATVFRGTPREHAVWLWAENAEAVRAAAQTLTSRSGFPDID
jgi:hypothetical protein